MPAFTARRGGAGWSESGTPSYPRSVGAATRKAACEASLRTRQPNAQAPWLVRVVAAEGHAVGHAGFHGPPDESGMVEIGYSVVPEFRRRGYAKAIVRALLEHAASEPEVTVVRASVSPDNEASLATIAGFGFTKVGEQWDDEDGLELLFERPTRSEGAL